MDPLVSVVIPNYNYARYLENRIQSVLNQTLQDFELILLDDASADNSIDIIDRYRSHPKVSHVEINAVNTGHPFAQWEKGISLAKGKYIWIAEADDMAEPDFLEHTVAALEKEPEASVAITMSHLIDSDGNPSAQKTYDTFPEDNTVRIYDGDSYLATRMLTQNNCYNASMTLFRKDAYDRISDKAYLDMRYAGDWYFWVEMINGNRIAEIRRRLNFFRLHSGSTTRKGIATPALKFERTMTMLNVIGHSKALPASCRKIYIYRLFRDFRKHGSDMAEYAPVLKKKFSSLNITQFSYPLYWIYKHLATPFVSYDIMEQKPIVTDSYPIC